MNRAHRLVWNRARRAWMAVGENAKAQGKGCAKPGRSGVWRWSMVAAVSLTALPVFAKTIAADAMPTGFEVVRGSGSAAQSGNTYTVTQDGARGAYRFKSFDIGTDATVNVKQQSGAVTLFLVGGSDPSAIYGKLNADSTLFIVNPNGMLFGRGASINVGGLLATTMALDPGQFMDGNYRLTAPGTGTIRNEGLLKAAGSVVLAGNTVENAGSIFATSVTLAAGNSVAVDITGNGLIRARVVDPALKASIVNTGNIDAVLSVALTAGQARDTLDRVVNNSGVIRATGLAVRGGEILLEGGAVANSGTLDASSTSGAGGSVGLWGRNVSLAASSVIDASGTAGGSVKVMGDMKAGRVDADGKILAKGSSDDGGFIETSAAQVRIADGFRVDARSARGRTGSWLIDPVDFTISAGSASQTTSGIGASTLASQLDGANVTIATDGSTGGNGDIFVNSVVSWCAGTTLTLSAHRNIYVNANITATGNGAGLKLFYGGSNEVTAPAANTGYELRATVTLSGLNPLLWIGNQQYTVVNNVNTLATLAQAQNLGGHYALGTDIDASPTALWDGGFVPIGSNLGAFFGVFDGLGHRISNLVISRPSTDYVGLFGYNTGIVRNVELAGGSINGRNYVGGLVGSNEGTVLNSGSSANVTGATYVGGLVGRNSANEIEEAVIRYSYATGDVTGTANGTWVGGLVGANGDAGLGGIYESYATGNVKYAGAGSFAKVGGLVGYNNDIISNSYATGAVANYSASGWVGGLVGHSASNGMITGSWSAGMTTYGGQSFGLNIGPFVGENNGIVSNSYWDKTNNCCGNVGYGTDNGSITNLIGLTSTQFLDPANLANLGFSGGVSSTWWMAANQTRPFLRSEWAGNIRNAHQLQLMAMTPGANYTQGADIDLTGALKPADLLIPGGGANYATAASLWAGWTGFNNGTGISADFVPIGPAGSEFSGTFDGQNHTISGLVINQPTSNNLGLFGVLQGATITNLGLLGVSISGANQVGGLAGYSGGSSIRNVYVTGDVTGTGRVGGLIGYSSTYYVGTTIADSHVDANVTGPTAGGLVGYNDAGSISGSFSAGTVTGNAGSNNRVGGLIGDNNTSGNVINNSYSIATVSSAGNFDDVGGLVGLLRLGTISSSYAAGEVTATGASAKVGGIVGTTVPSSYNTVSKTFWDMDATGQSACSGNGYGFDCTGLASPQMTWYSNYYNIGWDIANAGGSTSVWRIYDGFSYPLLRAFLTPLTITADNIHKVYDGNAYTGGLSNPAYSVAGADSSGLLFGGRDVYGSPTAVGNYAPQLYSSQSGYDISYSGATLSIASGGQIIVAPDDQPISPPPTVTPPSDATNASTAATQSSSTGGSNSSGGVGGPGVLGGSGNNSQIHNGTNDDSQPATGKPKGRMLVCRGKSA